MKGFSLAGLSGTVPIESAHGKISALRFLWKMTTIEGGGLGMLVFLQRWARDHDIRLKLFNPSRSVRQRLDLVSLLSEFDIPTIDEMMGSPGMC
jgi:hypothetical protein